MGRRRKTEEGERKQEKNEQDTEKEGLHSKKK